MAFATISLVPPAIEPFCWLIIFVICAILIVRRCQGKYFLHGFLVSLVNCVWITGVHILFYHTYAANHPQMVSMSQQWPLQQHPRLLMLIAGPFFGVAFGLVLGLFAFIAGKLIKKP